MKGAAARPRVAGVLIPAFRRPGARPWLLLALVALTLSCSVVETAITPTPRPAPTTVSHAAYSEWPLVLKDDFSQPDNDWETGQSNDRFSTGTVSIAGGKYRFDLKANDGFIWWSRSLDNTSTTDFYAAVDAQQITGPTNADYGLVFRWGRGNFYYFRISESGQFALSLYYFEKWETLVSWTSASAIRPGGVNRLAVGAEGSHFAFYVNG